MIQAMSNPPSCFTADTLNCKSLNGNGLAVSSRLTEWTLFAVTTCQKRRVEICNITKDENGEINSPLFYVKVLETGSPPKTTATRSDSTV